MMHCLNSSSLGSVSSNDDGNVSSDDIGSSNDDGSVSSDDRDDY